MQLMISRDHQSHEKMTCLHECENGPMLHEPVDPRSGPEDHDSRGISVQGLGMDFWDGLFYV